MANAQLSVNPNDNIRDQEVMPAVPKFYHEMMPIDQYSMQRRSTVLPSPSYPKITVAKRKLHPGVSVTKVFSSNSGSIKDIELPGNRFSYCETDYSTTLPAKYENGAFNPDINTTGFYGKCSTETKSSTVLMSQYPQYNSGYNDEYPLTPVSDLLQMTKLNISPSTSFSQMNNSTVNYASKTERESSGTRWSPLNVSHTSSTQYQPGAYSNAMPVTTQYQAIPHALSTQYQLSPLATVTQYQPASNTTCIQYHGSPTQYQPSHFGTPTRNPPPLLEAPTQYQPVPHGTPTRNPPPLLGAPAQNQPVPPGTPTLYHPVPHDTPTQYQPAPQSTPMQYQSVSGGTTMHYQSAHYADSTQFQSATHTTSMPYPLIHNVTSTHHPSVSHAISMPHQPHASDSSITMYRRYLHEARRGSSCQTESLGESPIVDLLPTFIPQNPLMPPIPDQAFR